MARILFAIGFIFLQLISQAQKSNAELLFQKTTIATNGNKLTKEHYFEIQINNRAGEEYTEFTIPYSNMNKLSNIKAYIKDSKGRIVKKLKKGDIIDRSSISDYSFYEDDFVKEFTLKHNIYPYTIIYSYTIQQNEFLHLAYWVPLIDKTIPTLSANLKLSVPIDYKMAYFDQHVKSPKIDTLENIVTYHWQTSYADLIEDEEFSPPLLSLVPSVTITPLEFNYEEEGSFKNWVSFGNWQYTIMKGLNELPGIEKNKVLSLIKDVTDIKEKIKILYRYLQEETRYINISIETGGLKPYPASYVAQNKYGDCKALTNYFKSLLDFIGVKSYYSKVYAGNPIVRVNKDFPSQQSNHIILYIPNKTEDIWLDCTSDGAFNYLGTFTQNRNALIIDYNNSHFVKTPALDLSDVAEKRKIQIDYKSQDAIVRFHNTYKGDMYEEISYVENNFGETDKLKFVQNHIVDEEFQLIDYQISVGDIDSAQISLSYKASSQNMYKHYGQDILIGNIAFSLPDLAKPGDRTLPVQIDYPIYKTDTIVYEIPSGYELIKSIVNHSISNKYGYYKLEGYENAGNIIVIKSLLINPGFYTLSNYEDFYNFYSQIIDLENKVHLSLKKQ